METIFRIVRSKGACNRVSEYNMETVQEWMDIIEKLKQENEKLKERIVELLVRNLKINNSSNDYNEHLKRYPHSL